MSGSWLSIVGIGEDGLDGLSARARRLVEGAELLVGGRRHLAMVPGDGRPRLAWHSPLEATLPEIEAKAPRPTVVLASGDPGWFGVASLLRRHFRDPPPLVIPAPSAFQLAAAALGWALEEVACVSLHGRPLATLHRHLVPDARLLILTSDACAPAAIAELVTDFGHGEARILVLEHLGGTKERIVEAKAADLPAGPWAELNLVALEVDRPRWSMGHASSIGLPDAAYGNDGQLTKRDVRAVTLARLAPGVSELLWDVGAGSGSVGIEWLRAGRRCRAIAIERNLARVERISRNAAHLGTPELVVVPGEAPDALHGLEDPHAIFVGGGVGDTALLDYCWSRLRTRGRLVANAVTLAGEAALVAFHTRVGFELVRLRVERTDLIGGRSAWRPAMPVTQLVAYKHDGW